MNRKQTIIPVQFCDPPPGKISAIGHVRPRGGLGIRLAALAWWALAFISGFGVGAWTMRQILEAGVR